MVGAVIRAAYGCRYTNKKSAVRAFKINREFVIESIALPWLGRYGCRTDLAAAGVKRVEIRYGNKSVAVVRL